ncbi:VOC family protein [Ectobacillus ponti]|uniref:VOC family protein n=1 Tax=Ectobacillus ponti TaxID=2961894 RepID=A0AA42BQH3_9BACI|nr:VOC family protein [Ectobacillus ponti]MCP8969401.1 VOC family protein [Ectobacillus ponti]
MKFHQYPHAFVSHARLNVQNLQRSLRFYQEVIGLRILEQSNHEASLTADGKTALLTLEQPADVLPKQPRATGLYHFALLLPNRAELGKALRHLLHTGWPLQGASDHHVSEAIYLGDPDGNGIEIYVDRPAEAWKWEGDHVFMTTVGMDAEGVLAEADESPWEGLPASTIMGHIHLHVSDLQEAEQFYTKGLGMDVVLHYGSQALFVSYGRYHHHIGLNTWNGVGAPAPARNSAGLQWYTLVLPSEEMRKQVVRQLQAIGSPVTEENGRFFTEDPAGNRILLHV